jgi:hypothetical protein
MVVKVRLRLHPQHVHWGGGTSLNLVAQSEQDEAEGAAFGKWSARADVTQKLRDEGVDEVDLDYLVPEGTKSLRPGSTIKLFAGTNCVAEAEVLR